MDLFTFADAYPNSPGYKARDTAEDAAKRAKPTAALLRSQCLDALREHGSMTADECAATIGKSVLSIRPRMSELVELGRIEDSGVRRTNDSGRSACVWRVR